MLMLVALQLKSAKTKANRK